MADAGKAVLLITHGLAEALPFADSVALMRGGRLVGVEPARSFSGSGDALVAAYAKALWRALPDNDFAAGARAHA
jgi:peptide/nickel transport system ATP-binding protein